MEIISGIRIHSKIMPHRLKGHSLQHQKVGCEHQYLDLRHLGITCLGLLLGISAIWFLQGPHILVILVLVLHQVHQVLHRLMEICINHMSMVMFIIIMQPVLDLIHPMPMVNIPELLLHLLEVIRAEHLHPPVIREHLHQPHLQDIPDI